MPKLVGNRYGKGRVRVLKILRDGATDRIKDQSVTAMRERIWNHLTPPVTTVRWSRPTQSKNTINARSQKHLGDEIERFGTVLGKNFLQFPQILQAAIGKRREFSPEYATSLS
jgi:urate oxidase